MMISTAILLVGLLLHFNSARSGIDLHDISNRTLSLFKGDGEILPRLTNPTAKKVKNHPLSADGFPNILSRNYFPSALNIVSPISAGEATT